MRRSDLKAEEHNDAKWRYACASILSLLQRKRHKSGNKGVSNYVSSTLVMRKLQARAGPRIIANCWRESSQLVGGVIFYIFAKQFLVLWTFSTKSCETPRKRIYLTYAFDLAPVQTELEAKKLLIENNCLLLMPVVSWVTLFIIRMKLLYVNSKPNMTCHSLYIIISFMTWNLL